MIIKVTLKPNESSKLIILPVNNCYIEGQAFIKFTNKLNSGFKTN